MNKQSNHIWKLGMFVIEHWWYLPQQFSLLENKKIFWINLSHPSKFQNVSGLTVGNNVRFSGINIGTVDEVQLVSDSSVVVSMTIEKKYKNSLKQMLKLAGSDGLMGMFTHRNPFEKK
jgi:phospholipid/cholesterol/gamma-HCH transport system substrate-binding protein